MPGLPSETTRLFRRVAYRSYHGPQLNPTKTVAFDIERIAVHVKRPKLIGGKKDTSVGLRNYATHTVEKLPIDDVATRFAVIYSGLNNRDEAFKWLEKAFEERQPYLTHLKVEPVFANLRPDSRFNDLAKRIGLTR